MSLFGEFREFAVKGNMVDMAVGIIMGAAFNKVVTSVVNDLLMPPLGMFIGGTEFKHLMIVLRGPHTLADGVQAPMVAIRYGAFINTVVEFLIVAFSMFIVVKMMNRIIRFRQGEKVSPSISG